jgi:SAM-dependent methyltransferase
MDLINFYYNPHLYSPSLKQKADNILNNLRGKKVLDIGCGSGWIARLAIKHGYNVTAMDISEKVVEENIFYQKNSGIRYDIIQGSAVKIPFPDQSFNSVIMTEVLEHLSDPELALKEIYRVLKSEGIIALSVPNGRTYGILMDGIILKFLNSEKSYESRLTAEFKKRGVNFTIDDADIGGPHLQQFSAGKLKTMFARNNFEIRIIYNDEFLLPYINGFFCSLLGVARKKLYWLEKIDMALARIIPRFLANGFLIIASKK